MQVLTNVHIVIYVHILTYQIKCSFTLLGLIIYMGHALILIKADVDTTIVLIKYQIPREVVIMSIKDLKEAQASCG